MNKIIVMILIALTSINVSAQKNIEKAIKEIESMKDVTATYSERRTPKDHKLYRISLVLNFSGSHDNHKIQERLAKAFEADRKDAISASKTNPMMYTYKFADDKGASTYTMYGFQITKKWVSAEADNQDESSVRTIIIDGTTSEFISKADLKSRKKLQRERAKLERQLAKKDRQLQKLEKRLRHDLAKQ